MARCSHVTWFKSGLFRTSTITRGSLHSRQYFEMVINSLMPFICIAPSPASAIATRPGHANFAFANLLFFAAWPMLTASFALYSLRDLDTKWTLQVSDVDSAATDRHRP